MAAFYGNRIRAGLMSVEEVPKLWRAKRVMVTAESGRLRK